MLADYARDPRDKVQSHISAVWGLFDAESYAKRVLAHAVRPDGRLLVDRIAHLAQLRHLDWLEDLRIFLFRRCTDLEFLRHAEGFPLSSLTVRCRGKVSLSPLRAHPGLKGLYLHGAAECGDLPALTALTKLERLSLRYFEGTLDLDILGQLPALKLLALSKCGEMDLSLLADLDVTVRVDDAERFRGTEALGDRLHSLR
ncbi:hypothetical protein GCM10010470_52640 [Saccharopolyspora taberi]|uniref:Leucine-rich repeat domain-containing protein n=1 Tax=Saccharopolyspora taberi TaxID=60895 RepID=A0ABN3VJA0_9PSEU